MKLIVGLGNFPKEYAHTRHNAGFLFLEYLAHKLNAEWKDMPKRLAEISTCDIASTKTLLVKPQTYMNNSGDAVLALATFYKIPYQDILVVYDDIDLPFGKLRFRDTGSSAGHKGIQSIVDRLGTQDIRRIRIGINHDDRGLPTDAFVLEQFSTEELASLPALFDRVQTEFFPHFFGPKK